VQRQECERACVCVRVCGGGACVRACVRACSFFIFKKVINVQQNAKVMKNNKINLYKEVVCRLNGNYII